MSAQVRSGMYSISIAILDEKRKLYIDKQANLLIKTITLF